MDKKIDQTEQILSITISRNEAIVLHRHSIQGVADMVAVLANHFEEDEDLAIILDCALKLYRRNTSTKARY